MGIIVGAGIVAYMWFKGFEGFWIAAAVLAQFVFSVMTVGTDPGIGSLIAFIAAIVAHYGG